MAEKRTEKKKKGRAERQPTRWERRFERSTKGLQAGLWGLVVSGGVLLGAGAWGQWGATPAVPYAPWLVTAGAVLTAGYLLMGDKTSGAIRVGDAGIGFEMPNGAIQRISWCDVKKILVREGELVIDASEITKSLSVAGQEQIVAWVVREAQERVPQVLTMDEARRDALPKTSDEDGEKLKVADLQVAGEKCRASGEVITFEQDARWCPRCGAVYHKDHVPESCVVCSANLT